MNPAEALPERDLKAQGAVLDLLLYECAFPPPVEGK
jgi:hypothetical protein